MRTQCFVVAYWLPFWHQDKQHRQQETLVPQMGTCLIQAHAQDWCSVMQDMLAKDFSQFFRVLFCYFCCYKQQEILPPWYSETCQALYTFMHIADSDGSSEHQVFNALHDNMSFPVLSIDLSFIEGQGRFWACQDVLVIGKFVAALMPLWRLITGNRAVP